MRINRREQRKKNRRFGVRGLIAAAAAVCVFCAGFGSCSHASETAAPLEPEPSDVRQEEVLENSGEAASEAPSSAASDAQERAEESDRLAFAGREDSSSETSDDRTVDGPAPETKTGNPEGQSSDGDKGARALTVEEKLALLREKFPDGMYWNHRGQDISGLSQEEASTIVTDEPCSHSVDGYEYCNGYNGETKDEFPYDTNIQCLAFSSMISDFLYGKGAEVEVFYDFDELGVGDHIRLLDYEHSMIVVEKGEDYVKVVECNRNYEDCMIEWDRELSRDEVLYGWASYEFLRRTAPQTEESA